MFKFLIFVLDEDFAVFFLAKDIENFNKKLDIVIHYRSFDLQKELLHSKVNGLIPDNCAQSVFLCLLRHHEICSHEWQPRQHISILVKLRWLKIVIFDHPICHSQALPLSTLLADLTSHQKVSIVIAFGTEEHWHLRTDEVVDLNMADVHHELDSFLGHVLGIRHFELARVVLHIEIIKTHVDELLRFVVNHRYPKAFEADFIVRSLFCLIYFLVLFLILITFVEVDVIRLFILLQNGNDFGSIS